jgi:hypothetical protein
MKTWTDGVDVKKELDTWKRRGAVLYSLIPFLDFKAVLGVDDRENALSRYCLITATYTIEQYCKRRLLRWEQLDLSFSFGTTHSVTHQHQILLIRR